MGLPKMKGSLLEYDDSIGIGLNVQFCQLKLAVAIALVGLGCFSDCAVAQIVPDTSLGVESSLVKQDVIVNGIPSDEILGGAIRGTNLFHSFREFSIGQGHGAYFANPTGIANIFSRVTGGKASNILGTLGVAGDANLFLINPSGIIFGNNSRLDIRGSFLGTTVDGIQFVDGTQFSAVDFANDPLLSINVPLGLQLGQSPAGAINAQKAFLQVQPGKTLALIGGNITLDDSNLVATNGRIELGSVSGSGLINIDPVINGFSFRYDSLQPLESNPQASGMAPMGSGNSIGALDVETGRLLIRNKANVSVFTEGTGSPGEMRIRAFESVELIGTNQNSDTTGLFAQVLESATGTGSNISIETKQFSARNSARVSLTTFGSGNAGNLVINASESINLRSGGSLFARVDAAAMGRGGNISITTKDLLIQEGSQIVVSTSGIGEAGDLTIRALSGSVELIGTDPNKARPSAILAEVNQGAVGAGGSVTIETGELNIRDGAQISTSTAGIGDAGDLIVRASNSVILSGDDKIIRAFFSPGSNIVFLIRTSNGFRSALFSESRLGATGNGGTVDITTPRLSIANNALISTSTAGTGDAGKLHIRASDSVEMYFGGMFSQVLEGGQGTGGTISVETRRLFLQRGSVIGVETTSGKGGGISLQVQDLLLLRDNSFISATAGTVGAPGNGGNIEIKSPFIVAVPRENSDIAADAFNGIGGQIRIDAEEIFGIEERDKRTPRSDITATSPVLAGDIVITTPDLDPGRELDRLPDDAVDPNRLVVKSCISSQQRSSEGFFVSNPNDLPPVDPVSELSEGSFSNPIFPKSNSISISNPEAQGWVRDQNNRNKVRFEKASSRSNSSLTSSACGAP
jgi:filamentous hemagglutinin family protein